MRILNLDVQNVLGVRRVITPLDTPVSLFAGGNAAGKSSLCEAIRMAFGEAPERVALKKEFRALVTEGASEGETSVGVSDGSRAPAFAYHLTLPDGKRHGRTDAPAALPFVLDPAAFVQLEPAERRTFLFGLTGCQVNADSVRALLLEKGATPERADKVLPMLRSGFPAAADFAKAQARDAKAAWKAITGETYGEKKAEGWQADRPASDPARIEAIGIELATLDDSISEGQTLLGQLSERQRQQRAQEQAQAERASKAAKAPDLRKKLAKEEAELLHWTQQVERLTGLAGAAPREGLVHDLATAVDYLLSFVDVDGQSDQDIAAAKALEAYEAQYGKVGAAGDPEAAAALPKAQNAHGLIARAIENTRRDLAAAEAAQVVDTELPDAPLVSEQDIANTSAELGKRRQLRKDLEAERQRLDTLAVAARQADDKAAKAAGHHADVLAWLAIEEELSPEGIPGRLLSKALRPVNDRLRDSAVETGWKQPVIGADMSIAADGRPYALLSESERWRVNAMVAEAISHLSGLRLLALDRMDVLEISARGELLGWLDGLAADGELDSALVFATLKALPKSLPETIAAYWIEAGEIADSAPARAAA